jgi:hypothetical protein
VPLPHHYNPKHNTWKVDCMFCSWSCAKSYALDRCQLSAAALLPLLRKQVTGQRVSDSIKPAPPRTALAMFGGPLSIEEFRADASTKETCYQELPGNVLLDAPVLTLVPSVTKAGGHCHAPKPLNFNSLTPGVRNETLRLKRPRPMKSKANNSMLEKIFGISAG